MREQMLDEDPAKREPWSAEVLGLNLSFKHIEAKEKRK